MKLIAHIDDKEFEIEVKKTGPKLFASIDGRDYDLEASKPESNIYLLKYNNKVFEVFVDLIDETGDVFTSKVRNSDFEITLEDPKRLRGSAANAGSAEGAVELKTAMPGKVVRILVTEGEEVVKGDGIVIVEAMKMQNEMKTAKDGVVKQICFEEGETVNAGDVLAVIE